MCRWATRQGLKAWQVLANCERALAIELLAGAQGVEFHAPLEPGTGVQATRSAVRELSPRLRDDRSLAPDIEEVAIAIRGGSLVAAAEARGGSAAMSTTETLAERVDALCGDLSHIRAPRGSELNARQWSTEAPLRMLLNNLDAEVAEKPEELIVYGGSGRAARSHEALRAIVGALLELGPDETLLVQSGKPVGIFTTHESAPRVLIANSLLVPKWAHVGRVPPARGGGPDDVRPDDRRLVDLHRHAGDPPGHLSDVRRCGREALRLRRPRGEDDPHGGARRHGRGAAARGDDGRRRDPLHRGRPAPDRAAARDALPRRGGGLARRRARAHSRGGGRGSRALGRAARERCGARAGARRAWRALRLRHRSDRGARSAERLRARRPVGRRGGCAARVRSGRVPAACARVDRATRRGHARVRPTRCVCFRLWQQPQRGGP